MNAVIRNGFFWTCQLVGLSTNTGNYVGDASGSNVTESAMQWLKFQISADYTSLTLADHGRVFDTNRTDKPLWYYMPSLMVNCSGDMVAGFSGSGPDQLHFGILHLATVEWCHPGQPATASAGHCLIWRQPLGRLLRHNS
jgi:hypothetical protein